MPGVFGSAAGHRDRATTRRAAYYYTRFHREQVRGRGLRSPLRSRVSLTQNITRPHFFSLRTYRYIYLYVCVYSGGAAADRRCVMSARERVCIIIIPRSTRPGCAARRSIKRARPSLASPPLYYNATFLPFIRHHFLPLSVRETKTMKNDD